MGLLEAAVANRADLVSQMLANGEVPEQTGYGGQTALAFAARHGNIEMVNQLLKAKAPVNARDLVKQTPLHEAAAAGHSKVVSRLLDARADFRANGFLGFTPLDCARKSNHADAATLLEKAFAGGRWDSQLTPRVMPPLPLEQIHLIENPIVGLSRCGDLDGVKDAIEVGFDPDGGPDIKTAVDNEEDPVQGRSMTYREVRRAEKGAKVPMSDAGRLAICSRAPLSEWEEAVVKGRERSPLAWAARGGHCEMLECLLEARADVDGMVQQPSDDDDIPVDGREAWTPLGLAAREGWASCVSLLLLARAECRGSVPRGERGGRPPVEWASRRGHGEVVVVWFDWLHKGGGESEGGARPNGVREEASALLPHACYGGSVHAVELLLKEGAPVSQQSGSLGGPLHIAASRGHVDLCSVLISSGALLEAMEAGGATPLCLAARQGHATTFRFLATAKANLSHSTTEGEMPLSLAAAADHVGVLQVVLELYRGEAQAKAAALSHRGAAGCSALARAAMGGSSACLDLLLKEGPHLLEKGDEDGSRPLALAAAGGHEDCISALLQAKAEIDAPNGHGNAALAAAVRLGHQGSAQLLLHAKAVVSKATRSPGRLLLFVAQSGRADIAALLLDHSANVNAVSLSTGVSALATAAFHGNEEVASLLMERGAYVNQADQGGWTPLALAAAHDHQGIVAELVSRGASIGPVAPGEAEPVKDAKHLAESNGHAQMVRLLRRLEMLGSI